MIRKTAEACREKIKELMSRNPGLSLNQIAKELGITVRAAKIYTDEICGARSDHEKFGRA